MSSKIGSDFCLLFFYYENNKSASRKYIDRKMKHRKGNFVTKKNKYLN